MTPTDRVVAIYLALTAALVLVFRESLPQWTLVVSAHVLGIVVVGSLRYLPKRLKALPAFLRDWYPAMAFPILYKEVELLAAAFGNWSLTETIQALEVSLFGGHPSLSLGERLAFVPLSEYLHFCYLSFLLWLPFVGGYWYFTGKRPWFHELLFLVTITFSVSYVVYIVFPVDSPFYLAEPLGPPLAGSFFHDLVHAVSSRGGARGGAFPSSHVSISTVSSSSRSSATVVCSLGSCLSTWGSSSPPSTVASTTPSTSSPAGRSPSRWWGSAGRQAQRAGEHSRGPGGPTILYLRTPSLGYWVLPAELPN